ncbi:hypothetical protein BUALT_Bualt06G0038300 [Buddleja alternifolia]|uniref:Uncharacterized protein n=1 Tax=Buddleja alternifolia TaxID=168488 RepID=A0AAV6XE04_9LAMI|nr:hypothetical protein BUALT_Bualt06G0038300 [Buddleja alternifolia]
MFQVIQHMYQWIINRMTAIKHVNDDYLPRELEIPRFTRFVDILPSEESDTLVDIIAIVIDKVEQRPVNTKYGVSTVQEFSSSMKRISLAARGFASIVVNPPYP